MPFLLFASLALAVLVVVLWRRQAALQRDHYIREFTLPAGLLDRLAKRRPEFSLKDRVLVARALRQFFLVYLHSGRRFVAMPSQAADDLWHEFILYTKNYDAFCRKAFGGFLHHTPAVVLGADRRNNEGLRRAWWYACREENIDPRRPARLPLLFALDAKLGLADGFTYALDCKLPRPDGRNVHCVADLGDAGIDGGTAGFGADSPGGVDGGTDGGGDGGGGCGGGGGD